MNGKDDWTIEMRKKENILMEELEKKGIGPELYMSIFNGLFTPKDLRTIADLIDERHELMLDGRKI